MTPARAARLHASVGAALERSGRGSIDELAGHFWRAADLLDDDRPVRYLVAAADEALQHLAHERAETRRLVCWFDCKFKEEVTVHLYGEKLLKRISRSGGPSSAALRAGRGNLRYHLEYIGWLCDRRTWLAGDDFSLADIAAGAHLSVLDYIGDVPWDDFEGAKLWYQRIKSRPSFRPLLADVLPGEEFVVVPRELLTRFAPEE
jgi:glutathione S-transferase